MPRRLILADADGTGRSVSDLAVPPCLIAATRDQGLLYVSRQTTCPFPLSSDQPQAFEVTRRHW